MSTNINNLFANPDDILANLIQHMGPWWDVITLVAALIGLAFCVMGAISLGNTQTMFRRRLQDGAIGLGLASFFVGVLLLNLGQVLDSVSVSVFNESSLRELSYQPPNPNTPTGVYIKFTILLIMLVGLFGVVRGFVLLRDSAQGKASFWYGLTHIVGGVIAINIVRFGEVLARSMGTAMADLFERMVGTV